MDHDNEDIGPVVWRPNAEETILKASSVEELCKALINVAQNVENEEDEWDEAFEEDLEDYNWESYELDKDCEDEEDCEDEWQYDSYLMEEKTKFIAKIMKECATLEDIEKVILNGDLYRSDDTCIDEIREIDVNSKKVECHTEYY